VTLRNSPVYARKKGGRGGRKGGGGGGGGVRIGLTSCGVPGESSLRTNRYKFSKRLFSHSRFGVILYRKFSTGLICENFY